MEDLATGTIAFDRSDLRTGFADSFAFKAGLAAFTGITIDLDLPATFEAGVADFVDSFDFGVKAFFTTPFLPEFFDRSAIGLTPMPSSFFSFLTTGCFKTVASTDVFFALRGEAADALTGFLAFKTAAFFPFDGNGRDGRFGEDLATETHTP